MEQTIKHVFRVADVADDEQVDTMIQTCDPQFWKDRQREDKLISHFGMRAYKQGFLVLIARVNEEIMAISGTLGFEEISNSDKDGVSEFEISLDFFL